MSIVYPEDALFPGEFQSLEEDAPGHVISLNAASFPSLSQVLVATHTGQVFDFSALNQKGEVEISDSGAVSEIEKAVGNKVIVS